MADGRGGGNVAVRGIAAFEALKGLLVLAAGFGLLHGLHHDGRLWAEALIRHAHLNPDGHFPHWFIERAGQLQQMNLTGAVLAGLAYVALRLAEAIGLWLGQAWGEWLGAGSGAIYLPIELSHLWHRPSLLVAGVLAFNLAVVWLLARRLQQRRQRRRSRRGGDPTGAPSAASRPD